MVAVEAPAGLQPDAVAEVAATPAPPLPCLAEFRWHTVHACLHSVPPGRRYMPACVLCVCRCRLINTIGLERGLDTLAWQLIASVAAPGYTIHTVVAAANWVLLKAEESQQARPGAGQGSG